MRPTGGLDSRRRDAGRPRESFTFVGQEPSGDIALSLGLIVELMNGGHVESRFRERPLMASLDAAQNMGREMRKVAEERRRLALKTRRSSAQAAGTAR